MKNEDLDFWVVMDGTWECGIGLKLKEELSLSIGAFFQVM